MMGEDEEIYHLLAELEQAVLVIDSEKRVIAANRVFLDAAGLEDFRGLTYEDVMGPEYATWRCEQCRVPFAVARVHFADIWNRKTGQLTPTFAQVLRLCHSRHRAVSVIVHTLRALELTRRQREVIEILACGYTADEAARLLEVTSSTIRNHVRVVYKKCGVHSLSEMIAYMLRGPLVADE